MKPVLKFEDGKIIPEEKVRTKKRAIQTLEKKVLDIVKDFEEVTLFVINGDHFEDGQALYKKLQDDCPSAYQVASNWLSCCSTFRFWWIRFLQAMLAEK